MDRGELLGLKDIGGTVSNIGIQCADSKENGFTSTPKDLAFSALNSSPASLTPSGSSPPDRKSISPNPTPTRQPNSISPAPPQHHISPDPATMTGSPFPLKTRTLDAFLQSGKRKRDMVDENTPLTPTDVSQCTPATGVTAATQGAAVPLNNGSLAQPPAKRKRATKAEVEARKAEEARVKQEKEAERALKAAEKEAAKAKAEADKQQKLEERELKKRQKEEQEAKKARNQKTLGSFFRIKPTTVKEKNTDIAADASPVGTPKKTAAKEVSVYEQMFQPFFVKDQVTMAPLFQADEETREAKTRIFEEYVEQKHGVIQVKPFDPEQALQLPFILPRGRLYTTVRSIMAELSDNSSSKPIDLTTESQNTQIRRVRNALRDVPMKFLGFKEDVRPPYYGTVTNMPGGLASLRKLARNPLGKDVLPLNYEYDSEAEWQEEDGEDVDLLDEEDDDVDNDEDMGDFLDDSEDAGLARPLLVSALEPESTGICWENRKRLGPAPHMYKFRMEFILDALDHHSGIDPFSTQYWEPVKPVPTAFTHLAPPKGLAPKPDSKSMPPPGPTDAFKTLASSGTTGGATKKSAAATSVLPAEMTQKMKDMIVAHRGLSKVGLVELFWSENKASKVAIKNTLEIVAEKSGKDWVLKAGQ